MPMIQIVLEERDGALSEWGGAQRELITPKDADMVRVVLLKDGMASGKHAVAFAAELEDGRVVVLKTSADALLTAVKVIEARIGSDLKLDSARDN